MQTDETGLVGRVAPRAPRFFYPNADQRH